MIYFLQAGTDGNIKIGYTASDDALVRMAQLQTGAPAVLRLLGTIPGTETDEKNLHRQFAAFRVCGEWFQPTADLLALIPAVDPLICGKVEVVKQSVQIRVMTVGRKQFGKSLLDQLPVSEIIDWANLFVCLEDETDEAIRGYDLSVSGQNEIWGWVAGGSGVYDLQSNERDDYRWIIYVHNGKLFKHQDWSHWYGAYGYRKPWSETQTDKERRFAKVAAFVYERRKKIIGFRDEDQLFIGV